MNDHDTEIPNVLACDCGNTTISLAWVASETVTEMRTFRLGELGELAAAVGNIWTQMPEPKRIVAASVNPTALRALEAAALKATAQDVLVVGKDIALPMATTAKHPETIGTDRICAAVAAFDRIGLACVVIDCGSAITIDAVNDEGVYLGGVILPGLAMAANALAQQTAQLPQVDIAAATPPEFVFGETTEQAILGGIVFGTRGAIRERIEAYATALGSWPVVILTGGDATLLCPHAGADEVVQAIVDDLTIRGIAMAYYKILAQ